MLLVQETKLDKKGSAGAQRYCEARGIAARFSARDDEAAREGTAVLVKMQSLALTASDVQFDSCSDGRCTVASFECHHRKERIASVYLPTRPSERADTIRQIKESKLLQRTTELW